MPTTISTSLLPFTSANIPTYILHLIQHPVTIPLTSDHTTHHKSSNKPTTSQSPYIQQHPHKQHSSTAPNPQLKTDVSYTTTTVTFSKHKCNSNQSIPNASSKAKSLESLQQPPPRQQYTQPSTWPLLLLHSPQLTQQPPAPGLINKSRFNPDTQTLSTNAPSFAISPTVPVWSGRDYLQNPKIHRSELDRTRIFFLVESQSPSELCRCSNRIERLERLEMDSFSDLQPDFYSLFPKSLSIFPFFLNILSPLFKNNKSRKRSLKKIQEEDTQKNSQETAANKTISNHLKPI